MLKDEKKILNSPALDTPDKSVLQDAKAYMPKKKGVNTRLARILAPIACVIVVAVVLGMIPAMIPANSSQPPPFPIEFMGVDTISSIAEYNAVNNTSVLHIDSNTSAITYSYDETVMVVEEKSIVHGSEVTLSVVLLDNSRYTYLELVEKLEEGFDKNVEWIYVGELQVCFATDNGKIYIKFLYENNGYYLEIVNAVPDDDAAIGEIFVQNILSELLD